MRRERLNIPVVHPDPPVRGARVALYALSALGLTGLLLFGAHAGFGLWAAQKTAFQVLYVGLYLFPAALCIGRAILVPSERRPWLLFGLGMVALAAGYAHYFLVLEHLVTPPSPSLSDALWLVFYALSFVAVLLLLRSRISNAPRTIAIDALIGVLTLAAVAATLLVDPILETTGGSIAGVSTNLAYPLFDLLIIGLVAPVFVFSGWRPNKEWWLIGAAFACQLVLDTVSLSEAAAGAYVAGTLPEALSPAVMLLIAYAAWRTPERRTAVNFKGWATVVVPSLFVVVAIALTSYDSFRSANDLAVILTTAVLVLAVVRVATSFADVRSRERSAELERRLQQSQRLESVGQLAGGIAHDFNNMLAVILNCASFVRDEVSDRDDLRQDVDEIQRAAERATALTRQLLTFSRRDVIKPELLDLNAVVADLEKLLTRTLGEDIELRTRPAPGLPAVEADRSQVEQVLLNLAVNARDAMPEGGRLTIETARVNRGGDVRLRVIDTGCGMPQELVPRAFDPFYSTKPRDQGSGLGLSTVYGIVTGNGGLIDLRSEPGRGTTVEVTLPAAAQEEATGPSTRRRKPAPTRSAETTILLVEDELAVREVTRRILSKHGHEVLAAGSPSEALRVLSNHEWPLGLLLTDVVMPDMSGIELAKRITEIQPNVPILYMSGYSEEIVSRHGGLDSGAPLLQKPFGAESLLACVQDAVLAK